MSFFSALRKRLEGEQDDDIPGIIELVDSPSAVVAKDLSEYMETEETSPGFIKEEDLPF